MELMNKILDDMEKIGEKLEKMIVTWDMKPRANQTFVTFDVKQPTKTPEDNEQN